MVVFESFDDLDDEKKFVAIVESHFANGWPSLEQYFGTKITLDPARLELAYETYQLSLSQYTVALKSQNPDHYKRGAALLHALYQSKPVVNVEWDTTTDYYRDFNNVGVSFADSEHYNEYCSWFENYANPAVAFELAFRCCQVYEDELREYDTDFLDNMCYYMTENTSINVGSFVMILKAFMN